jgi:hypothetical protein
MFIRVYKEKCNIVTVLHLKKIKLKNKKKFFTVTFLDVTPKKTR